ncbi:3'(2'),5'-bisphosphate nucleotidase CysQ [Formosa maritima]|uniref:3'(2'),5'-bisphosphate nucleotidase CysQ n=1 Tax=Formosa maritima TaxID=2592046 RepID=A0A5D0G2E0_9FLAO|nr:3'(2'),5'-bisphosphate nucleotidase CysQ [Formosa maritima]TYA52222.1 3'(2'),5'-bisphosphate nucleotidase CysQ [Formosa maritima]
MQEKYINQVIAVAKAAGKAILEIYNADDFGIEIKADESPLTLADKAAHRIIVEGLKDTRLPVLSEEGKLIDFSKRQKWREFWMVDPVDGTKEFIKRNGEFTVNIALIRDNKPVFGVVYAPVLDKLYYGGEGLGAFMIEKDKITILETNKNTTNIVRIVASRSHLNQDTQDFIDQFETTEIISMGSSLKFMLVAEGKADIYPRFAPTMEWDTAAAHAILVGLGIEVIEPKTKLPLHYNKLNLLNPYFMTWAQ